MEGIVRTRDDFRFGVARRYVFGLNLLAVNRVEVGADDDPRMRFLRAVCEGRSCSAHTGNLRQLALTPQEMFGPPGAVNNYVEAGVGVYGGTFYDASSWPNFPPCFFPDIKGGFWEATNFDGSAGLGEVVDLGALALYVEPGDSAFDKLSPLLQPGRFQGHEEWLKTVAGFYKLIVVADSDGDYFSVFAQRESDFNLLDPAITRAVQSIESTAWYRRHSAALEWDGEYNMCLMLPELMRR